MNKSYKQSRLGIIGGILISMAFIILSFVLILYNKEGYGLTLIGGYIVSIVGLFISKDSKNKSLKEKEKNKETDKNEES